MQTKIRSEVSEKNPYWIEKHRYLELKHFCLQYPIWKKAYTSLDGLSRRPADLALFRTTEVGNPTARCAIAKAFYSEKLDLINQVATKTDPDFAAYILLGVTEGLSFDTLKIKYGIPCCKDVYYTLYRKFFWLLNKERG